MMHAFCDVRFSSQFQAMHWQPLDMPTRTPGLAAVAAMRVQSEQIKFVLNLCDKLANIDVACASKPSAHDMSQVLRMLAVPFKCHTGEEISVNADDEMVIDLTDDADSEEIASTFVLRPPPGLDDLPLHDIELLSMREQPSAGTVFAPVDALPLQDAEQSLSDESRNSSDESRNSSHKLRSSSDDSRSLPTAELKRRISELESALSWAEPWAEGRYSTINITMFTQIREEHHRLVATLAEQWGAGR